MSKITAWFARSQKAIAGLVGAVLTWCSVIANQRGGFNNISAIEWVALGIAVATALGVYTATNAPAASNIPPHGPLV